VSLLASKCGNGTIIANVLINVPFLFLAEVMSLLASKCGTIIANVLLMFHFYSLLK
jgi:hypothetical protein